MSLNQMKKINYKKVNGFSALELMLVLALIGIAIIAVVRTMGTNNDKQDSQTMLTDVENITSGIQQQFHSGNQQYTNLTTKAAIDMGVIPKSLPQPGGTSISNKWGGTVEIAAANNNQSFTVTYTLVPSAVCNIVVNGIGSGTFQQVQVAGTTVYENDSTANTPLDPVNVATQCSSATSVTVIFTAS